MNVLLAWGLYVWSPRYAPPVFATQDDAARIWARCWPDPTQKRLGQPVRPPEVIVVHATEVPQYRFTQTWLEGSSKDDGGLAAYAWEMQIGWPARSLAGRVPSGSGTTVGLLDARALSITRTSLPYQQLHHRLPWLPLWPGFLTNTLFYASLLWLIFFSPGVVRRAHRKRNNRCLRCAYPVGGSDLCTECGTPIGRSALPS